MVLKLNSSTNVIVTGGAGMIGSNLVKRLRSIGCSVRVIDNLWRGKRENLFEDGSPVIDFESDFIEADLTDPAVCRQYIRDADIVYHLADIVAGINYVFGNESFLFRQNIVMNTNVLSAAIENGIESYVYVGTACSYPKEKQAFLNPPPFKEEDVYPAEPESAYGWSKLMGEYEAELAQKAGSINVGILRLHNVYGTPSELSPERSQVIPALCRKAILYPDEDFVVWGSGSQARAFVHIDDVLEALLSVYSSGMNAGPIQIGPSKSTSIREIAEMIVEISGKPIEIQYDTSKPEGDVDRSADYSKAERVLGWEPRTDISKGLREVYSWAEKELEKTV